MENNHEGHRQRLKNRVKKYGLNSLEKHEILELLLTYSIPRKNTNSISHELLNKFGSLSSVIEADDLHLKLIKGLGEESCLFIKVIRDFINIYLEDKNNYKNIIFKNNQDVITYFRKNFIKQNTETFVGFCLSSKGKLLNYFSFEGKSETEINISTNLLIDYISPNSVQQLVLVHTHPNGSVHPSTEDITTTNRISNLCVVFGCHLVDHLILNSETYCSLKDIGYMPKNVNLETAKVEIAKDEFITKRKRK